jgi:membrane protease YdiL (CAAX protease family)
MRDTVKIFYITLFWGLVIGFLMAVGQIVPIYVYALFTEPTVSLNGLRGLMGLVKENAFLLAITAIGSTLFVVPFVLAIGILQKRWKLRDHFDFNRVKFKTFKFWFFIAVILLVVQDYVLPLLVEQDMPDFMLNITYPSEFSKWLLLFGVAFMSPILEEVIFRGYLLKGFAHSFIGVYGAIVLTSAIWAFIHFQYELVYLVMIFVIGLVLGYARFKANSIYVPIMMHIFFNLMAGIELYIRKGIL